MEVEAHLVVVPTTTSTVTLTPSRKDLTTEALGSVKWIFTPQNINMTHCDFPICMKKPWEIHLQIGYTPGRGLGRQKQGMKDVFEMLKEHNGAGLGYSWHLSKDLTKPLT